jgi:hypothetical protein
MVTSNYDVLRLLKVGRERLQRGWCQGALARTADGIAVNPENPRAAQWCMLGAVGYMPLINTSVPANLAVWPASQAIYETLCQRCANKPTIAFNDSLGRTKEEVIHIYDLTIARLEAQQ